MFSLSTFFLSFVFVFCQGCPNSISVGRAKGTDDSKGPYKVLKEYYGTYSMEIGLINGKNWWVKDDNDDYKIHYVSRKELFFISL